MNWIADGGPCDTEGESDCLKDVEGKAQVSLFVRPAAAVLLTLQFSFLIAHAAELPVVQQLESPGGEGSGMPYFATSRDGGVILSWLEPEGTGGKRQSLRVARRWNGKWQDTVTVRTADDWFINWADFPSVVELPDGTLLAHWLQRTSTQSYGYKIGIARANRWNGSWQDVTFPQPNDPSDYSGFLSWGVAGGKARAAYLAPPVAGHKPNAGHGEHRKTLRVVSFDSSGAVQTDAELDGDTCSCCPTAIASTGRGLIVAYRDHSPGEIRDISVVRERDGRWTGPQALHADGWKINGCPTDGPSMLARGNQVAVAWLTRANDRPKVQAVFSTNAGESFGTPIQVDDGNPLGRPATAWLRNDLLVVWLEKAGTGIEVKLRRIAPDGTRGPSLRIAVTPAGRAAGFPKIAIAGDNTVLLAWREGRVRTAALAESFIP